MCRLTQVAVIVTSCWSVVVGVVVECCCCIPYRLALMLVPTVAPSVLTFAPCALTFAPCTCGVVLLSTSASTPLAHMVVVTGCNLDWWRFPSAIGANTPCPGSDATCCNLHWWSFFHPLVHMQCAGCLWWWYIYVNYIMSKYTLGYASIGSVSRLLVLNLHYNPCVVQ